jgi:hypothetical protein
LFSDKACSFRASHRRRHPSHICSAKFWRFSEMSSVLHAWIRPTLVALLGYSQRRCQLLAWAQPRQHFLGTSQAPCSCMSSTKTCSTSQASPRGPPLSVDPDRCIPVYTEILSADLATTGDSSRTKGLGRWGFVQSIFSRSTAAAPVAVYWCLHWLAELLEYRVGSSSQWRVF